MQTHNFGFQYHPDILARFPHVCGGVILAQGLHNGPTPATLSAAFQAEQQAVKERIGDTPLSELAHLAAWRAAFRAFGVDPTGYRSAIEALLRRLTKKGDIPSINSLVDLCNLVSIRVQLPVAAFDARALQGAITVRFASGNERFINLAQEEVEHPAPGEVIFSDESELVFARRWCWRQSEASSARLDTTYAILTVEAQHAGGRQDVQLALSDLMQLMQVYVGGELKSGIVDAQSPAFTWE